MTGLEWPDYDCPECGSDVWLDGFDDATVLEPDSGREIAHCGVCELVVIRRV